MLKLEQGIVISYQGSRALVQTADGCQHLCKLRSSMRALVTGDGVELERIQDEYLVVAQLPRDSEIYRTDSRGQRKSIAANLDCLAIVVAVLPEPHTALIDKYLVAANLNQLSAILIINKIDLAGADRLNSMAEIYLQLGIPVFRVSVEDPSSLSELKAVLSDRRLAFVGQSGVGKSSLTNILVSGADARVGTLSTKRSKGRHTTSASHIYHLRSGGWILDSPGIREFEIRDLTADDIEGGFSDIHEVGAACKFRNCAHNGDRGCAVEEAVNRRQIAPERYKNYLAMRSLAGFS